MESTLPTQVEKITPLFVPVGEDRFGEFKILGISKISFKVSKQESSDVLAVEITLEQKGGPEKHLHYFQDEWFYALEGDLLIEAGDERYRMKPGDSLWVRRTIPHGWANTANKRMRFLAFVSPAGNLEEFFINASQGKVLPGPDPKNWQPYGLEWVGPPLKFE